ncbi:alkene reductase [Acetobacter sp. TBRC 12305]|uniref:Alkene reductase n=1 Tax=Acetobacter garciniae TaxID=2817435 RepID=A0A939HNL3_9PROT|nr:alkene reductase [Acetobacter garciniae]MBO1324304.1 alkene reductase [Acetobacter garciniae]MBX0343993.1 alkene reductase [Acetobacter garciniae]
MASLFTPLQVGALTLPNRVIMAPLTRQRAGESHIPNDLMATYYVQRALAGLIISEATPVSPQGIGYAGVPGLWLPEHVEGWRKITSAVHDVGGRIFLQLWHVGRISDPVFLGGELPVAPSAIAAKGHVSQLRPERPYVTPRALETHEIPGIVATFRRGAELAHEAHFDGVEIHGANGYLLDQFLQDSTNHRTDQYGGSIENRARLMLEVTDAAITVWGPGRVGMHLSPRCDAHDMGDSNPAATFGYVASELGRRGIAFICAREAVGPDSLGPQLKKTFGGVYIANEAFTGASAEKAIEEGRADAVAFGKAFIANPDLPERLRTGADLTPPDPSTFYGGDARGYIDYPTLGASGD